MYGAFRYLQLMTPPRDVSCTLRVSSPGALSTPSDCNSVSRRSIIIGHGLPSRLSRLRDRCDD